MAELWCSTIVFKMDKIFFLTLSGNVCFDSRQKVGYFDFCGCKFYYLCHKPVSAHLWEFITVTVKDLSFKVFFIVIPVRKTFMSILLKFTKLIINFTKG